MNHTLSPGQPRDHLFDNIKALMLFLVPLGHTLDVFIADGNVEEILMKYIYLFHMPIFAFVTGYFTKNLDKARENAVKKCLIPYLVFQGLYILMAVAMLRLGLAQFNAGTFNASILLPSSAFYYLLAVFFWKLLGKSFFSFRHPLALSVALGLLISCTSYQDFHAGLAPSFPCSRSLCWVCFAPERRSNAFGRSPSSWACSFCWPASCPQCSCPTPSTASA